jgi:hypothetical protein
VDQLTWSVGPQDPVSIGWRASALLMTAMADLLDEELATSYAGLDGGPTIAEIAEAEVPEEERLQLMCHQATGLAYTWVDRPADALPVLRLALDSDVPGAVDLTGQLLVDAAEALPEPGARADELAAVVDELTPLLGTESEAVLRARTSLVCALAMAGRSATAIPLIPPLLGDLVSARGSDDPETLDARLMFGELEARAEHGAEDLPRWQSLVADCARVFGDEDERTLEARFLHARAVTATLGPNDGHVEAFALRSDVERLLPPPHPLSVSVRQFAATFPG